MENKNEKQQLLVKSSASDRMLLPPAEHLHRSTGSHMVFRICRSSLMLKRERRVCYFDISMGKANSKPKKGTETVKEEMPPISPALMKDNSAITVVGERSMCLEVVPLSGQSFKVRVTAGGTVLHIKKQITAHLGTSHRMQQLFFDSKHLSDYESIDSCGVADGQSVHLVLLPPGPDAYRIDGGKMGGAHTDNPS